MKPEDELLWGVLAIANEIGRPPRATYNLLRKGHITPARKVGNRWVVSRQSLWSWIRGDGGGRIEIRPISFDARLTGEQLARAVRGNYGPRGPGAS